MVGQSENLPVGAAKYLTIEKYARCLIGVADMMKSELGWSCQPLASVHPNVCICPAYMEVALVYEDGTTKIQLKRMIL